MNFSETTVGYARRLTITGLCVACSVILCRFLGFSPEFTMVRFEIGFLPIALIGHLFGPVYSGPAYLAADLLGCLVAGQTINPLISLCKLITGLLMGLFLYRRRISPLISVLSMTVIAVIVEFLMMTGVFVVWFSYPFDSAVVMRALTAGLNLPLRILLLCLLGRFLKSARGRYFEQQWAK